jgi:hypothetical protein
LGTKKILGVFILLSLIYLGLTFGLPPDEMSKQKYNLSTTDLRLLQLTLAVPIVAIWFVAYYGYARFRRYASLVKDSKEGKSWEEIVKGLLGLGLWLPVSSIVSVITTQIYRNDNSLMPTMVILTNYINLAILLAVFLFLYRGTNDLVKSLNKPVKIGIKNFMTAALLVCGGLFVYLTLANPNKNLAVSASTPAAYYLPDWLLITTIIIPYLLIFYVGVRAVQNINMYGRVVKGSIYKNALRYLADGIGVVVLTILSIRYLASLSSVFTDKTLNAILLIIYLLIFLIAAGYVLIALGAKRLQRLEEV